MGQLNRLPALMAILLTILSGCGVEQTGPATLPGASPAISEDLPQRRVTSSPTGPTTAVIKREATATATGTHAAATLTPEPTPTRQPTSTRPTTSTPAPAPPSNPATERLTVSIEDLPTGDRAWQPSISADGRYLAHTYGWMDTLQVILHDLAARTATLVSAAPDGSPGDRVSFNPEISADGSVVAFRSNASNLVENPFAGCPDEFGRRACFSIYLYHVASGRLERLFPGRSTASAALSADGRYLAFSSSSGDLSGSYVYDRETDSLTHISEAIGVVDMSADGSVVAFVSQEALVPEDSNETRDVYLLDRATGQMERISAPVDGVEQGGQSGIYLAAPSGHLTTGGRVALSAGGRYVAFGSTMPNLVEMELPSCSGHVLNAMESYQGPCPQYYVHDRETGRTEVVSLADDGRPANGNSFGNGDISADGRFVAFTSTARNLWPARPPYCTSFVRRPCVQVFVRDRAEGRTYLIGEGWGSQAAHHAGQGNRKLRKS